MKYTGLFILFSLMIIVICGFGIGFIIQQQDPIRHFRKGKSSYESGNFDQAIESLNEYLSYGRNNEESRQARYFLAASVSKKNINTSFGDRLSEAIRERDELAKKKFLDVINENDKKTYLIEAIIGYAEICQKHGTYDRFITHKLEEAIHAFPNSRLEDEINTLLGYQFLFSRDFNKAMNSFLQASTELSKLGQAKVHFQLNQFESAFRIYEDFFNFFPSSQYIDEVKKTYLSQVIYYAGLFQDNKKHIEAIQNYKKLIHFFPDMPETERARFEVGKSYFDIENYEQAKNYFTTAYEDKYHEFDDDSLYFIGVCYYELGKTIESYKSFNLLLNSFPTSIYVGRSQQWVRQLKKDLEYFQN